MPHTDWCPALPPSPFFFCASAMRIGMFAAMMKFLMHPADEGQVVCAGKGGSHGDVFMMEHAISMLKAQGHNGDKSKIMMIGDRFDTDIRGGVSVGIKTCLVESGAHQARMQGSFPLDSATYTAPSVAWLNPRSKRDLLAARVTANWGPAVDRVGFDSRTQPVHSVRGRILSADGKQQDNHFQIASSSVSELSRDEATMKAQVNGAFAKLTTSLGATPSFVVMTGTATKHSASCIMDALVGPCRAAGTVLHGCSTFHGAMTNDSLGDDLGLLGIVDVAGRYSTGWAPGASDEEDAQQAGYSAAATALATSGAKTLRGPSLILVTATPGMEEQVIAGVEQLLKLKSYPSVPILGGSCAPPDAASVVGNTFVLGIHGELGLKACFEAQRNTVQDKDIDRGAVVVSMLWPSVEAEVVFDTVLPDESRPTGVVTARGRTIQQVDGLPAVTWYNRHRRPADGENTQQDQPLSPLMVTEGAGARCVSVSALSEESGTVILNASVQNGSVVSMLRSVEAALTVSFATFPLVCLSHAGASPLTAHPPFCPICSLCCCLRLTSVAQSCLRHGWARQRRASEAVMGC